MSPHFNPALLKLARESHGWPQTTLASEAGIGQGTVSKYEKGLVAPSASQVAALAEALAVPVDFFSRQDVQPAAVLYRSRALRSARAEATVRARINLARLVAQRLLEDIDIDTVSRFPDPDRSYDDTEDAAGALRTGWWLPPGPIASVTGAIESAGGIVLRVDLGCDQVDAAYLHPLGDPVRWFFVNTQVTAGDRVRFSLAHEVGHAVMHEVTLLPDTKIAEDESNHFAGAFLLPRAELRRELPRGRLRVAHLVELKRRWGVSMGAIAMRAAQLGVVDRRALSALWREIGWRGYRTNEPVDVPLEQPTVFAAALRIQRDEHRLTEDDLATLAGVTRQSLADLFPEHFERPVQRGHLAIVSGRTARPQIRRA